MPQPEDSESLEQSSHLSAGLLIDPIAVQELKTRLRGRILQPTDDGFDTARQVFNGAIDKTPLFIAQCVGVADVIHCVNFARTHRLLLAIRGSGHNVAGHGVCGGGMVIDLSLMKGIRVDPQQQTAWAEAGVTWGEFDHETQAHGLATPGGEVPGVGIAGLTLGGGMGWLMSKYGLACDNLLAADVVTADGQFLTASATSHPELFWALRGGGGNFGVVTSLTYQLHPVGQVLAGMLFYLFDRLTDVLQLYRAVTETAPDELTTYLALYTFADNISVVVINVCYIGPLAEGEKVLQPLRNSSYLIRDFVRPMSYQQLQSMLANSVNAHQQCYWKSSFLSTLSDEAISTLVSYFKRVPSTKTAVFLEHFHGAARRVDEHATAFSHRGAAYNLLIASYWSDEADTARNKQWSDEFFSVIQLFSTNSAYINYLGEETQERIKEIYGAEKYERLVAIKKRYDPTNLFRINHNIKPPTSETLEKPFSN